MARHRNKSQTCPNCGTALQADHAFCPHCGQENHDLRIPFRHFAYEFIESITHFDTKLWSTIKLIFTRPGQLTADHVQGRRARYVNPARFYIFISVIFFTLLTLQMDRSLETTGADEAETPELDLRRARLHSLLREQPDLQHRWDSLTNENVRFSVPIDRPYYRAAAQRLRHADEQGLDSLLAGSEDTLAGTRATLRSALATLPDVDSLNVTYFRRLNGVNMSFSERGEERWFLKGEMTDADVDSLLGDHRDSLNWLERRALRSLGRLDMSSATGKKILAHAVVKAVSVIMFLLMPFTAVLLLWIFFRKRFYWEHLIFSVHIHTIFFLFFSMALAITLLLGAAWPYWLSATMLALCLAYLLASLHRVYGRPWPATLGRLVLMSLPYTLVFLVLLVAGVVWGFISL